MNKTQWHLNHEKNGYEVERVVTGQTRPCGPTVNKYIVRDLTGKRTEQEIREYCTTVIKRADDPKRHLLIEHLIIFRLLDDGSSYLYCSGHDWTG